MDLGPHAVFIWASWGAATVILAALILWLVVDGRAQKRRLAELEQRGLGRSRQ